MSYIAYVFFIFCSVSTISILLLKKRSLDFLSIYVAVLFLYSIPLFFGKVINVYSGEFVDCEPETLVVMGVAFVANIFFLIRRESVSTPPLNKTKNSSFALLLILIVSILSIFFYLPTALSSSSKVELLENTNLFSFTIYSSFPVIGFLVALNERNKKYLIIFSCILLAAFAFGGRRAVVLALLGAIVISLKGKEIRIINSYRYIIVAVFFMLIAILGKTLYGFVLRDGVIGGISSWAENFNSKYFLVGSEFLGTSTILNQVVLSDFSSDWGYYFLSFFALLPIPLSYFGYKSSYFNDAFQPELFPGINYGMAYNPWAEAYSVFGFFGVLVLSFAIPAFLVFGWRQCRKLNNLLYVFMVFVFVLFSFWIQRNSLGSIFAYVRNVGYPLVLFYFTYVFLIKVLPKKIKY